jgi:hypothetical protein
VTFRGTTVGAAIIPLGTEREGETGDTGTLAAAMSFCDRATSITTAGPNCAKEDGPAMDADAACALAMDAFMLATRSDAQEAHPVAVCEFGGNGSVSRTYMSATP